MYLTLRVRLPKSLSSNTPATPDWPRRKGAESSLEVRAENFWNAMKMGFGSDHQGGTKTENLGDGNNGEGSSLRSNQLAFGRSLQSASTLLGLLVFHHSLT